MLWRMKSNDCATTACKASSYQPRVTLWVIVTGRAMRPARAEAQTVDQAFALAGRVFPSPNKTQGDALGYEFVDPTGRLNINTLAQLIFHYKSSVAHFKFSVAHFEHSDPQILGYTRGMSLRLFTF